MHKIKHRVYIEKNPNGYSVTEWTFDNGRTVNHYVHATDLPMKKDAIALKKSILNCYK